MPSYRLSLKPLQSLYVQINCFFIIYFFFLDNAQNSARSIAQYSHLILHAQKLVWLITMYLNETYTKNCVGEHLSKTLHNHNGVKIRLLL